MSCNNKEEITSNLFRLLIGNLNLSVLNSDKCNRCTGLLQANVEASRFINNRHMTVVVSSKHWQPLEPESTPGP
jgi:hypothetical protein